MTHPEATAAPGSVLVVEDRAHIRRGHLPVRFAEVAAGFASLGHHVEVLTSRGWSLEHEQTVPFSVHRYGATAGTLERLGGRLARVPRASRASRWVQSAGSMLRVAVMVGAARARRARMPYDTVIVIVSDHNDAGLIAALAGRGRWLKYVFYPPKAASTTQAGTRVESVVRHWATRADHARRARGGRFVIAAPAAPLRDEWVQALPGLEVAVLPVAGVSEHAVIGDARRRLGVERPDRVALLFGAAYPTKDVDVVFRAFAEHAGGMLAGWQLVAIGTVADAAPAGACALARPGFVDDDLRALAFSAADLVVISFRPGFLANSGTLVDTISWGVPVVCSDQCAPAEVVREYALGTTFAAGDAASLAAAVRAALPAIAASDLTRARAELSNRTVAQHALDALA